MREILIIGNGISGMMCAIRCAEHGLHVRLVAPGPSEQSQSVMAAGGINAVTEDHEDGDAIDCHVEDTLKGGAYIAGRNSVYGLCSHAEEIIQYLEKIGTVFTINEKGRPAFRAFGGQSHKRTYYCGSSTGKQIVSALTMECRRFEGQGLITRVQRQHFYSALIEDGICYGAILYDEKSRTLIPVYADALVMATGGQNCLYGKTTGSGRCDGYAVGKLFMQGAVLKNLEFIQYHPTTLETPQKRMLVSEAVRGEGGRLFYFDGEKKVYFMEDKFGPRGNLMTRDVISREIISTGKDVFLDISFMDKKLIDSKIPEVRDLCEKYRGIDISKMPIPVAPSVHFFMGGLAVHKDHESSFKNLYGIGECASMYHGANRLGGNSLLAACYSGMVAADSIYGKNLSEKHPDFTGFISTEQKNLKKRLNSYSSFAAMHIRDMLADTMREHMSIVRSEESLKQGIEDVSYLLSVVDRINYDPSVSAYANYSLKGILTLGKAALTCAQARKESRGAHYRTDYPQSQKEYETATLISYENGNYKVSLDMEHVYEN
ncbi:FAD-binding protein [Butyrivibrio sp. LC3010]|uniref:FAD-binding protein n=1 Tax=Butyrivibrio sp. LC3010 TaxID=1280680 RepID=UPI00041ADB24|nr:FAD-binding protein [Butyrivibrio sp. LC3010]